jgi:cobalamin biosynthesis protein CobT
MKFNRTDCQNSFTIDYANNPSGLGATRSNLLRILRSIDLVGWNTHEESGRLDRKAFTRFASGSVAVFSKRTYVEAERSAVSVLIDCSGSMDNDGRIRTAQTVAIQLAKILDKANVEYAVTGFCGNEWRDGGDASGASKKINVKVHAPRFIPFKKWGESLSKASAKMGAIRSSANSSTPDYGALSLIIDEMSQRQEPRKIIFLLTDADGYNIPQMKYLQKLADKQGVLIVAVGIGYTQVKQCFTNAENVTSVQDLASASLNKMLKTLTK